MNDFTIRQLTTTDLPAFHALLTVFGEAFNETATFNDARPPRIISPASSPATIS